MNIGVIFAGGVGKRMHSKDKPKQFLEIFSKPIIIHTLEHFENNDLVDAVVIASLVDWIPHLEGLLQRFGIRKVKKIVPGGETGQMSIYHGLLAAKELAGDEKSIVLIHDGVRPLINSELLTENIRCVQEKGSCVTTGIVTETAVVIDAERKISEVHQRDLARVAKAPQSYWLDEILAVQKRAVGEGVTDAIDSCTLMQMYGHTLYTIDGPKENIKITTPDDFFTMRSILEVRENNQIYTDVPVTP